MTRIVVQVSYGILLGFRSPLTYATPSATSGRSSGASRRRKLCSATSSVFQITTVALSTFLNRLAAATVTGPTERVDDVSPSVEHQFGPDRTLKTASSARVVPVHKALIRARSG